jgi:hypothetical protein
LSGLQPDPIGDPFPERLGLRHLMGCELGLAAQQQYPVRVGTAAVQSRDCEPAPLRPDRGRRRHFPSPHLSDEIVLNARRDGGTPVQQRDRTLLA